MPTTLGNTTVYAPGELGTSAAPSQYATASGGNGQVDVANYRNPDGTVNAALQPAASLPVSSLSSSSGATTIDQHVADHTKDMAAIAPAPSTTTSPAPTAGTVDNSLKGQGGISLDEANAAKPDLTNYTYDPATKYFMPKATTTSTPAADAQYAADQKTINDAFATQVSSMDAATKALMSSINGIYSARISDQQEANRRELAAFSTMNTRYGTARYAPGVAQGILTADERVGLDRIQKIALEEANLLASANQALTDKKYAAFVQQRNELSDLRKERVATLQKLQEAAAKKTVDDRNYALEVDKFNQTKAQDAVTNDRLQQQIDQGKYEFRDIKDPITGAVTGTQVFSKLTGRPVSTISIPGLSPTPGSNGPLNPVGLGPDGKVDTAAQAKFLATLPPAISALVTGLITYQAKPPTNSAGGKALNAYAHLADPTYDESQYVVRQKVNLDYTSGATGKNIQSLNTAVNHLVDLSQSFAGLPNGDLTKYNTIKDWYDANVGKGNITKVITDLNAVTGELAKVFKGTGATDEEIKNLKNGISVSSSPEQFKSFIEEAISLLGGRIDALNGSYETAVGKPFPRNFINPATMQKLSALRDQGYQIDVPGVTSTIGGNIEKALSATNPDTGAAYTPAEIADHLKSDPTYGAKVEEALSQGISPEDILDYLKGI